MGLMQINKKGNWGWCIHCERAIDPDIFWEIGQSSDHKCPFDDCDGSGIGVDLEEIPADSPEDIRPQNWPTDQKPVHGNRYPLYKEDDDDDDGDTTMLIRKD